jgi:hypothetical protein
MSFKLIKGLPMSIPRTAGILKIFEDLPENLKAYLSHFPSLARDYPWEVSISYLFAQTELAQNMTVYGTVVKLHRVDSSVAKSTVDSHHMTRNRFRELYKIITNTEISAEAITSVKDAEKIRDRILHGKNVSDSDKRKSVVSILEYARLLNEQVFEDAGFRPFGSMQGYKGRAISLDKSTSKWVLTGIGLIGVKKAQT